MGWSDAYRVPEFLALYSIGNMYKEGHGLDKSRYKADIFYQRAREKQAENLTLGIPKVRKTEKFVRKDYVEVIKWYEELANQGDTNAQKNMAKIYTNGESVEKDDSKAFNWYEKAAIQGDLDAQVKVGVMYANGTGVEKDDVKALKWLGEACDKGIQKGCDNYRKVNIR